MNNVICTFANENHALLRKYVSRKTIVEDTEPDFYVLSDHQLRDLYIDITPAAWM